VIVRVVRFLNHNGSLIFRKPSITI